jgi:signal transduction histidine kinase
MTIQRRLLLFFLIVVLIPMADTGFLTARTLTSILEDRAQKSLETDLKMARSVVLQRLEALTRAAQQTAALSFMSTAAPDQATLQQIREALMQLKRAQRLSFATLLGPGAGEAAHGPSASGLAAGRAASGEAVTPSAAEANSEPGLTEANAADAETGGGVVLCRANGFQTGDAYPALTVLEGAWAGQVSSGPEFIRTKLVEEEGLRQLVQVPLETPTHIFGEGLALVTAVPVADASGQVQAVLVVGELLNNNTVIPDLVGEPTGHILSFWLHDICIATNARRKDGARALGEKLPYGLGLAATEATYHDLKLGGEFEKALRSHIRNARNVVVGALEVGIPLRELDEPRRRALTIVILACVAGVAIASMLAFYLARRISRPLGEMVGVTRRIARGDLSATVPVSGKDEVAELAQSINQMTRDLAQAQERLVRNNRLAAIGQLAGSVSHELRNPLSVLRSSAYYLRTRLGTADEKVTKHLGIIEQEIANSDKIISDLLDFSRTKPPTLQRTYLNYVLEEALGRVRVPAAVTVKSELGDGLPPMRADTFQLEQVFVNLVTNAIQAMPQGGTLRLATYREDGTLAVQVSDTGVGIKPEHLPQLFEPLFTTKARGIGLGLAVCKTLVENHGGSIRVESVVGRGTTFTVTLPLHMESAELPAEEETRAAADETVRAAAGEAEAHG